MNRQLGKLGEELVVRFEQQRLRQAGRDDLAAEGQWVAETIGDGLGFDILSFEVIEGGEAERLIEVKTTGLGKFFPFYVTATELHCSEDVPDNFACTGSSTCRGRAAAYVLEGVERAVPAGAGAVPGDDLTSVPDHAAGCGPPSGAYTIPHVRVQRRRRPSPRRTR
jgi:hypothetical protein